MKYYISHASPSSVVAVQKSVYNVDMMIKTDYKATYIIFVGLNNLISIFLSVLSLLKKHSVLASALLLVLIAVNKY